MKNDGTSRNRRRRRRGDGGVYKRNDGLWVGALSLGRNSKTGRRRRQHVYGRTEREACAKLKKITGDASKGVRPDKSRETVAVFFDSWLARIKELKRPATYRAYEAYVRNHINGAVGIGHIRLRDLEADHIEALFARLRKAQIGAAAAKQVHTVLNAAMRYAVRNLGLATNPVARVDAPKYAAPEMKALSDKQVRALISAVKGDRNEALFIVAVLTGGRKGELLGLQFGDVSLEDRTIQIRRTLLLTPKGQPPRTGPPKTRKSQRLIPLPKIAVESLAAHRQKMLDAGLSVNDDSFVFQRPEGGPLSSQTALDSLRRILKKAGLPVATRFQDLRHTFATLQMKLGTNPRIVQEALGHSNITTTMNTYSHVSPGLTRKAADALDRAFS